MIEEKAAALPQLDKDALNYLRYFISGAVECPVKQGRITLPPDRREIADLDRDVVLVGELKRFEIWERGRWAKEFKRAREIFSQSSQKLSDLGI